jgi:RNA polymerase-interacting CarD/CdnL/TRCF family regulator
MFSVDEMLIYKGHGLVRVVGITKKKVGEPGGTYYMLKSARAPLSQTKLMVNVQGAEQVLRYLLNKTQAQELLDVLADTPAELPEDPRERMQILDEILQGKDMKEMAAIVRDYRESKLLNIERPEHKRVKAISRNLAEELCYVLGVTRAALRGKLYARSLT